MNNKYIELLTKNKGLDIENNKIESIKVSVSVRKKKYNIVLTLKNTLSFNELKDFINVSNTILKKDDIMINHHITYLNNTLSEENYLDYFNNIVEEICLSNPSYQVFSNFEIEYKNNKYIIHVDDPNLYTELINYIEDIFLDYFLDFKCELVVDDTIKSVEEIKEEIVNKEIEKVNQYQKQALYDQQRNIKLTNNTKVDYSKKGKSNICDIPLTQTQLATYQNVYDSSFFLIEGEIFFIEIRDLRNSKLLILRVTDYTDSIEVKKYIHSDKDLEEYKKLEIGDILEITGKANYDIYSHDVVIMAEAITFIGKKSSKSVFDNSTQKRVELHCHTNMSSMDGQGSASEWLDFVIGLGHQGIAITDHNGVYNFPALAKYNIPEDFKIIYGVELNFVDDESDFDICFNPIDSNLLDTTFVVFDVETTGFSQTYDRLIEIAACKMHKGQIIDTFSSYINPLMEISPKITSLTSITNQMVENAPLVDEVLKKFLDFCKNSVLVAHNASFDMGMLYANLKRINLDHIKFTYIDTLNMLRALHNKELARFNLKAMSKFFKVKQEQHHSAVDDTRVACECFSFMLQECYSMGLKNVNEINSIIPDDMYKFVIPKHINILVKTQKGLKNLYKLTSDALTDHCYNDARLLKSVLNKYKDGLLISSGCSKNIIFQTALNGDTSDLMRHLEYYDIVEVQPPSAYLHLFKEVTNGEETIKEVIQKIISCAKELNKIVVASSDCHYLTKDMKPYREILISTKFQQVLHDLALYEEKPDMHFRTTDEMLNDFSFLEDKALIKEIVITNTNKVLDMVEKIKVFSSEMLAPKDDVFKDKLNIDSIESEVRRIVYENLNRVYGENPLTLVKKRVEHELECIISNGFASVYFMSYLLVKKSLEDGYLVGSRGSVGSSFVATMMNITEVNPLSPHYVCKGCSFSVFKLNEEEKRLYESELTDNHKLFFDDLAKVESGFDLPDNVCPICGQRLSKDGHDIPFETFLGFKGDKVPDIDLNFSGEYQTNAHEFVRELLGEDSTFRGGTIGTIGDKQGFGYVRGYFEQKQTELRNAEIERLATKLNGIRRSTSQHPGGIIIVPANHEIYDVTPVQYPADNTDNSFKTTHYDYHSFEKNLLKLDILGHDDPTIVRFLMDYVNEHPSEFPFNNASDIPIDDKNVYRLFSSTDVIGVTKDQINSSVASYAVPEFGTKFVRDMLQDTMPKTFSGLVKISGLSHGTDVWKNNAKSLVQGETDFGKIDFSEIIGCRDDIMVYLSYRGIEPAMAFQIMEFVRRGNASKSKHKEEWEKYKTILRQKEIPEWYIWSCERIQYMFPKAHATAYVLMAVRIAWFKVYAPVLFYSAYFSIRTKAHHVEAFLGGEHEINKLINQLSNKVKPTAKDQDLLTTLFVALEMVCRGIKFLPLDINKSHSRNYVIENGGLRIPFIAFDGLGDSVADDILEKRNIKEFTSKEDFKTRTKINKTVMEGFENMGVFDGLAEYDEDDSYGLFALDDN